MGTRADFYIGRGLTAEWLGSIAWDGYPSGIPDEIKAMGNELDYRKAVESFIQNREDGTVPEQGWPWPWCDSRTTDYAYAFDYGVVYGACFGHSWFVATEAEPDYDDDEAQTCVFPDMSKVQNVDLGKRSGLLVISAHTRQTDGKLG